MTRPWLYRAVLAAAIATTTLTGCSSEPTIDGAAEAYTKLALSLGELDGDYISSYSGPNEWRAAASVAKTGLAEIRDSAVELRQDLSTLEPADDPMEQLRHRSLDQRLTAMIARIETLGGSAPASFDEETKRLYDVVLPVRNDKFFRGLFNRLGEVLPGDEPLIDRVARLQGRRLAVPPSVLPAVFEAAVAECRRRTLAQIDLPDNEAVRFEYLSDAPFGARTIYVGDGTSLLQLNVSVPISFENVVKTACHEGYPGHHVQNVLLDKHLAQDRGWVEFSVVPRYSAGALLAEGAAYYGDALAFPREELRRFKTDVLLPLAGVDPAELGEPSAIPEDVRELAEQILDQLAGVEEEVARQYLDGKFDRETALQWLGVFDLARGPDAAASTLEAIEQDRTYLINRGYAEIYTRWLIEKKLGVTGDERWAAMADLFTRPWVGVER